MKKIFNILYKIYKNMYNKLINIKIFSKWSEKIMAKLTLKNCTKSELKERLEKAISTVKLGCIYICLDSRYSKNPTLDLRREAEGLTTYGTIEVDGCGVYRVLNSVFAGEEYYDELDTFVDDLYAHIVDAYQWCQ